MRALCVVLCCHTATCYVSETCCVCRRTLLSPLDLYLATWIDHIRFADGMITIKKRRSPKVAPFRRVMSGTLISPVMIEEASHDGSSNSPRRSATAGLSARERVELTTGLGFYQNTMDLVPVDVSTLFVHNGVGSPPDTRDISTNTMSESAYTTRETAYVPFAGAVEGAAMEPVSLDILAVQVLMEQPTPCLPFYFYSNVTAQVRVVNSDLNHIYSDAELDIVDPLLTATRQFCMDNRYIGTHWSCPGALVIAVKQAIDAFRQGDVVPNNYYYAHIAPNLF